MLGVDSLRIGLRSGISLRVRIRRCSISGICRIRRVYAGIRTSVGIGFSARRVDGSIARIVSALVIRGVTVTGRFVSSGHALVRGGFHSGRRIFRKRGGGGGITHAAQHGDRCEHSHYTFCKSSPGLRLIFMCMPHEHPLKSCAITRLTTRNLSSCQDSQHLLRARKILTVLQLWKLEGKGLPCVHPKCGKVGYRTIDGNC